MQKHAVADTAHAKVGNSDYSVLSIDLLSLGGCFGDKRKHLGVLFY